LGRAHQHLEGIAGMVPNPERFPPGCKFHPRCPRMNGDPVCAAQEPALREVAAMHWASCHHLEDFTAKPLTRPTLDWRRAAAEVLP